VGCLAVTLNAANNGLFLPAVEIWSAERSENGSSVGFQQKHARTGLAYLVQDADGEFEESNVKARGLETDISPVAVAVSLFLSASLALSYFCSDSQSAIQGAVPGRLPNRPKVVQISVRDFDLRLLLNLIGRHYPELDGSDLHGRIVHDRLLGPPMSLVPRHDARLICVL